MSKSNLLHQRFGRLLVIQEGKIYRGNVKWICKCDCGDVKSILGFNLTGGKTKSCGCWQREKNATLWLKHGDARNKKTSAEYKSWDRMMQRCYNLRHKYYRYYGGRGIKVCAKWHIYKAFLSDMGRRPSAQHTLERINNDSNYEPANCKWATRTEQLNNTRRNKFITYSGKTMTLKQWSREVGINYATLTGRLRRGWTSEEALKKTVDMKYRNQRNANV